MRTSIHVLLLFLLSYTLPMTAQNSLEILDPNWFQSYGDQGTIEEASFTIEPKGIYMEVGMTLTISAQDVYFADWMQTEIVFDFNLPDGSIIHDSWLWMEDDTTIVKADILEYTEAVLIFEDIVDRQQDPSLLYIKDNGGYQIRIFPLSPGHTRKIKINYLTPAVWSETEVKAVLPTELLKSSREPLNSFQVVTFIDPDWHNPRLSLDQDNGFVTFFDPDFGIILVTDVTIDSLSGPVEFIVDSPIYGQNTYLSTLDEGADKFYQIVYFPPEIVATSPPKKIAFLFDHESANAQIDKVVLYNYVLDLIEEYLKPQDLFNIIFSNPSGPELISNTWMSANIISNSIALSLSDPIQDYSDILGVLSSGVQFVKSNGGEGEILLITSGDNLTWWTSNSDAQSIVDEIDEDDIRINIVDYQSENYIQNWSNGVTTFHGRNRNFHEILSTTTSGNLYSPIDGHYSIWESLEAAIGTIKNEGYIFDLYPNFDNGFTYDRYYQRYLGHSQGPGKPIFQVGKYVGDLPLTLNFTAQTNGNFISDNQIVDAASSFYSDTLTREIWTGHHLDFLDGGALSPSEIQDIVDLSIEERVLSHHTAFLALDLEQGAEPCLTCWEAGDNGGTVAISEPENVLDYFDAKIFPNPFTDFCQIEIEVDEGSEINEIEILIVDILGKRITTIMGGTSISNERLIFNWDGTDDFGNKVSPGTYFVMIKTNKGIETLKLNYIH